MPFALSVAKIEEVLTQSGCPVCRLVHKEALHSIDVFLWENVTSPSARKPINDAYGFCPEHTQMFVASELANTGVPLGVNMVYEMLANNASQELHAYEREDRALGWAIKLLQRVGLKRKPASDNLLRSRGPCPICESSRQNAENVLSTLMEVLEKDPQDFKARYSQSTGLCLQHLKLGLDQNAASFPAAARYLVEESATRLKNQRELMLSFIHKNNWSYREQALTQEEQDAWQKTVTFFSGLSPDKFNHHIPEY